MAYCGICFVISVVGLFGAFICCLRFGCFWFDLVMLVIVACCI